MFKFSRKPARDEVLGKYALELAMFMRWCETCGPGQLPPDRCVEVAERILVREGFRAASQDPLHVATLATVSNFAQVDELRARTGFDSKVKAFCISIGITLPSLPVRADLPDELKLFGQDYQAALVKLKSDTAFRAEFFRPRN
jgi:hypothetical protein